MKSIILISVGVAGSFALVVVLVLVLVQRMNVFSNYLIEQDYPFPDSSSDIATPTDAYLLFEHTLSPHVALRLAVHPDNGWKVHQDHYAGELIKQLNEVAFLYNESNSAEITIYLQALDTAPQRPMQSVVHDLIREMSTQEQVGSVIYNVKQNQRFASSQAYDALHGYKRNGDVRLLRTIAYIDNSTLVFMTFEAREEDYNMVADDFFMLASQFDFAFQ